MFEPRVAVASLSGESDADWARAAAPHVGAAFLGGVAIDEPTRMAARRMVANRDRTEFLPEDPVAFIDGQLAALTDVDLRPGVNVRAAAPDPVAAVAAVCAEHGAVLEVNAHCRQAELCAAGTGEVLLAAPDRLAGQVAAASEAGATVSVKVRTEVVPDLPATCRRASEAGADVIHVDAMDSEPEVADVVDAVDAFVVANNGVRDRATVREYRSYGADAVSVGRPSDRPEVLRRVRAATEELVAERSEGDEDGVTARAGEGVDP